jgi:hypothetical protein
MRVRALLSVAAALMVSYATPVFATTFNLGSIGPGLYVEADEVTAQKDLPIYIDFTLTQAEYVSVSESVLGSGYLNKGDLDLYKDPATLLYSDALSPSGKVDQYAVIGSGEGYLLPTGSYFVEDIGTFKGRAAGVTNSITVTAIPEPAAWALMLVGFAALGFVGYRRGGSARAYIAEL